MLVCNVTPSPQPKCLVSFWGSDLLIGGASLSFLGLGVMLQYNGLTWPAVDAVALAPAVTGAA
jgi:hypothetical protein